MFKKLSEKIGLTQTEIKVIIFLLSTLTLGFGAKLFFKHKIVSKEYDYSSEDSLFNVEGSSSKESKKKSETDNKIVDYKKEVLDFKKTNFSYNEKKQLPSPKSININKAEAKQFIMLPGIGEKTAEKIIAFRKKNGNFQKLEDIIKVKGIGTSKFRKIKKYLYIDIK